MSTGPVIVCDGSTLQPRDACPNPLHDDPMPSGYAASFEEANRRYAAKRLNRKCPECGLYGWTP